MKSFDEGLQYYRRSLKKRFPEKSMVDIDVAIDQALEEMKPSRARTRLHRLVISILAGKRDSLPPSA